MLHLLLILNIIILCPKVEPKKDFDADTDLGGNLVAQLKNDRNLDLSEDEEYEDLRAEFLAYHTALASIASLDTRRSLISTPCWRLGGICINHNLCTGFKSLSEVPGCKDKLRVCCFVWNKFNVRDMRDEGLGTLAMPWSTQQDFGGKGVVKVEPKKHKSKNKRIPKSSLRSADDNSRSIALIIRTNK